MLSQGITILLPNGDPNGVKIIEISGWSGKVFVIPRAKLSEIKDRSEAKQPALYFLFGEGVDQSGTFAYIGESERFFDRLISHEAGKEFWDEAIIFTGELDRAVVKYLESKAISLGKQVGRYKIENKVAPVQNQL